jgi:hypothetical protein
MQEPPGPFERVIQTEPPSRDRAAEIIVVAGIVLGLFMLILVLPPISILDNGGDDNSSSGPVTATARDEMPPAPAGFEPVSALYDLTSSEPVNRAATVGVELTSEQAADTELFLYTYQDETWTQVGTAVVVAEGNAASGEVDPLPGNVAVFRRSGEASRAVIGSLPANADADEALLDMLTTLSPQGYTLSSDGSIAGEVAALPEGLDAAIVPTIGADTDTLTAVLSSEETRAAHVDAIAGLVEDNDYAGIDLDYRTLNAEGGADFVALVTSLSGRLEQAGKTLSLTLPAPVLRGSDWDTRGFDWDALAPLADALKVVPDGDPGTYYGTLNDALGYLVPRAGASKLYVTVDPLSHESTTEGVRSLTLTDALAIASVPAVDVEQPVSPGSDVQLSGQNLSDQSGGSPLHWDDTAKAVAFSYVGAGGQRTVWLANTFSVTATLELAERYQLGGVFVADVSSVAGAAGISGAVAQYRSGGDIEPTQPNGELLLPHWSATDGTLDNETGAAVRWQAPDSAGEYTVTLIVSDGAARVGQEIHLSVGP